MIYRARVLVPMAGPPIDDGAVRVHGNRITWAGKFHERASEDEVVDLGEQVLLPGLINAHCHLDFSMMRRVIAPQKSFARWIERLNALKRELDDDDYLAAIATGFHELRRWGTTTVFNIESFPELLVQMQPPPIRTWWFFEMIDVRQRITTEDVVAGALLFFEQHPKWLGGFGLSPHSPYTASLRLYEMADLCAREFGMPLTTHIAESAEETLMFREGRGALFDFLQKLGRSMDDCGKNPVVRHLLNHNLINSRWIFAHMNEVDAEDFALLATNGQANQLNVVHCPRSHRYFDHRPFQFQRLHELGGNICIGTDSLASVDSLDLFAELRVARETQPWLNAHELLKTVTVNAARCVNQPLGCIRAGALADMIALPFSGDTGAVYDAVIDNREPVKWTMIDGVI